jgi:hypothetical protein
MYMRRSLFKTALPLLLVTALLASPSCIFDPKEDPLIPPVVPIEWPDMTDRDDVIKTIVLCYENPKEGTAEAKYNALLHSLYYFKLHPDDITGPLYSPIITRADDILSTEWIFRVQTLLELTLTETGSWYEYPEIEGEPCENCWETTRQYFVRAQFGDETTIWQSPPERAFVIIIAVPDENDATKWVLRAMFDLGI